MACELPRRCLRVDHPVCRRIVAAQLAFDTTLARHPPTLGGKQRVSATFAPLDEKVFGGVRTSCARIASIALGRPATSAGGSRITGLNHPTVAGLSTMGVTMRSMRRTTRAAVARRSTVAATSAMAGTPLRRTARTCFVAHTRRMDAITTPASHTGRIQPCTNTNVARSRARSVQIPRSGCHDEKARDAAQVRQPAAGCPGHQRCRERASGRSSIAASAPDATRYLASARARFMRRRTSHSATARAVSCHIE